MKKQNIQILLIILVILTIVVSIVVYSKVQFSKKNSSNILKKQYNMIIPENKKISAQELITLINKAEDINRKSKDAIEEVSEEHKANVTEKLHKMEEEKKPNIENENVYFPKIKNKKIKIEIQIRNEEYVPGKDIPKNIIVSPESIMEKGYYKFLEVFGNTNFEIREIKYNEDGLVNYIRVRSIEEI